MNAHVKIIVRTDFLKKDGSNPVCLRVTINRKVKNYTLGVYVKPGMWDTKNLLLKKVCPDSYKNNLLITNAIKRANDILYDYSLNNKSLTLGEFDRLFSKPTFKGNSFYEFAEQDIENNKPKFSYYTIKTIKGHISKLKKFAPSLSFSDITVSFLRDYDNYMITQLKNELNTRAKALAVLKSILNRALKEGLIKENVFCKYPITRKPGKREFLTSDELSQVIKFYKETKDTSYYTVLKSFLFSCYTGLRYQDVKNLRFSNISGGMIRIIMHKTKDAVDIPLLPEAKKLVGYGFPNQKVFRVFVNQYLNRVLKDVMSDIGINRKISFHCARHTFATIGISSRIPIEVLSKLLGHKDLKTTQIYAKIANDLKISYMKQWNKIDKELDPAVSA